MKHQVYKNFNIAFFPGVFDKIYQDQLNGLRKTKKQFGFDKIIFVNYNNHPHVDNASIPSLKDRFNYINKAIAPYSYLDQYTIDFKTTRKIHLYDIIKYLQKTFDLDKVNLIMGNKTIGYDFYKWDSIKKMANVYLMPINRKIISPVNVVTNNDMWGMKTLNKIGYYLHDRIKSLRTNEYIIPPDNPSKNTQFTPDTTIKTVLRKDKIMHRLINPDLSKIVNKVYMQDTRPL